MCNLYENIEHLCKENGTNITAMCKEIGVSRSALSEFKAGRTRTLSSSILQKIAEYFSVSTDYLLGRTHEKQLNSSVSSNLGFENEFFTALPRKKKNMVIMKKGSKAGQDVIEISEEDFEAVREFLNLINKSKKNG